MKKKVLMVGHIPPPPGGIAMLMQNLLDSSLVDKYDVSVLNISRKRRRYNVVDGAGFCSFLYLALHLMKLIYLMCKEKPEIVHVQSSTSAFLRDSLFILLSDLWGKKVICHLHGFYSKRHIAFKYDVFSHYSQFAMNRVDVLILLSKSFVPDFDKIFSKTRKVIVPNFVSQSFLKTDRTANRGSGPKINILYIGRLSKLKGTYDLLKAASLLKKDNRVQFLLAGLGRTKDDEKEIRSLIDKDGLQSIVTLLGYVEGKGKIDLLSNSDIFILPSYTEIFPVVIVEAMAAAVPIIATPVGAVTEIVQNGINGFIVPPGNPKVLADRILYLVRNPEMRREMGSNNLQKFKQEYDIQVNIDRIDKIYRSLQGSFL